MIERVLFSLKLLLFLFQAPCGGDEPPPEAFLFEGFLWDYEIFVTCRRSGNGGTHTCLPAAHRVAPSAAWYGPASASTTQDPREGPSLARRTTPRPPRGSASLGWLPRGREFYGRCTSRGLARPGGRQAGANGRIAPVSSLVQGRQAAGAESRGISQRFPFWCN